MAEIIKTNWSLIHYKSPHGMVIAALENSINEKHEGYTIMITLHDLWVKIWTNNPEMDYDECKSLLKESQNWNPDLLLTALNEFMQVVDPNLIEFVNTAISEFVSEDDKLQYKFYSI